MKTDTIKSIEKYMNEHGLMTLATVNEDGQPMAHSVEYVSEGNTIYFASHPQLRKMQNIEKNSKVAYTIDEDYQDWTKIQGIQMLGKASFIKEDKEIQRVMGIYAQKFTQVAHMPAEFAQALRLVKVEPVQAIFIDNSKGQGSKETVEY